MTQIIVYVEGPSDKLAMEELLSDLLTQLQKQGIAVNFTPTHGKKRLMQKTPVKAINILRNNPKSIVIALPDLYPPNQGGLPHHTKEELIAALQTAFNKILREKGLSNLPLQERFRVFCFKYDLEALLLASKNQLAARLGVSTLPVAWTVPVENQNHNKPPKRIIEDLFQQHKDKYQDTIDAPLILGASRYADIADRCPQCFKPFVDYLESLLH